MNQVFDTSRFAAASIHPRTSYIGSTCTPIFSAGNSEKVTLLSCGENPKRAVQASNADMSRAKRQQPSIDKSLGKLQPEHVLELRALWAKIPRIPTLKSRRAWAKVGIFVEKVQADITGSWR